MNILGTEYRFVEEPLSDADGLCDYSTKKITINSEITKSAPDQVEDLDYVRQKVIRHEIIHAYLYESGLCDYSQDETLVEWLAYQLPHIITTIHEAE